MTAPEPDDAPLTPMPDATSAARAARQRFFAIGIFRLSGALILVLGVAIAQQRFGWVTGQKARIMGIITVVVGFVQMIVIPRLLLSAFSTKAKK